MFLRIIFSQLFIAKCFKKSVLFFKKEKKKKSLLQC